MHTHEYPIEFTCPICLDLFSDPVCWPVEQCAYHKFCRECLDRSVFKLASRCPICRSATTITDVWALPTDEGLAAEIAAAYPEQHATNVRRSTALRQCLESLEKLALPLLEHVENTLHPRTLRALGDGSSIKSGATLEVQLRTPQHFLLLATCLSATQSPNQKKRFGLLFDGQTQRGFLAGIVSPQLPTYRSVAEGLTRLYFARQHFKQPMVLKLLLVDTFALHGPPHRAACEPGFVDMLRIDDAHPENALLVGDLVTGAARRQNDERFRTLADDAANAWAA